MDEEQCQKGSTLQEQSLSLPAKFERMIKKQHNMFTKINHLMNQTIDAIQQSEQDVKGTQMDTQQAMNKLHSRMIEIKPLKNLKDEYNDFYKKLSGIRKNIEESSQYEALSFNTASIFDEDDYKTIEESFVDHYLRKKQFQSADVIQPDSRKKQIFTQCQQLKSDILAKNFDRPARWAQSPLVCQKQKEISYEIKKNKIFAMVASDKGSEALEYYRIHMPMYTDIKEQQIRNLITFILIESEGMWGGSPLEIKQLFHSNYVRLLNIDIEKVGEDFERAFFRINSISYQNAVTKCHQIGQKYRKDFLQNIRFLQKSAELPKLFPFSINTSEEDRYHSQFLCPVTKQVHASKDKNIIMKCGHIISGLAYSKITESRNVRRKIRCPVCQEDNHVLNNLEVQF